MSYSNIPENLKAKSTPVPPERASKTAGPDSYREFLVEVGRGKLLGVHFYGGLVDVDEVLDPDVAADIAADHMLLGDDMAGFAYGFSKLDWSVALVSSDGEITTEAPTLRDFIDQFIERRTG